MAETRNAFVLPRHRLLRWLVDPGRDMPQRVAADLLGELLASPRTWFIGFANGLVVSVVGVCLGKISLFGYFIAADLVLAAFRYVIICRVIEATRRGVTTPTDSYLATGILWCAFQGAIAFMAVRTGDGTLQFIAAMSVMGLVGPICARNYAAPRYAMTQVVLTLIPLAAGAALSGNNWLILSLLQCPLLIIGVAKLTGRLKKMAIATLQAESDSHDRARHDSLTGLLNRFGLSEAIAEGFSHESQGCILFYLDLDGFKHINDTFGHPTGDKLLQAVAGRLMSVARPNDIVVRLGGDEFVIVAKDMPAREGAGHAQAIINEVAGKPYLLDGLRPLKIGLSIGFACAPEDGQPNEDLHRKADAALYDAKAAGKGVQKRFASRNTATGMLNAPDVELCDARNGMRAA